MSNMVVRTNVFALNAHRNMANVGRDQQTASNRLSSGFRINSAADDAAGLAISENMRAQIRGLDQASRNTQDGQSMILTTEGGLEEIGNMLQRVRELLVQASNDTNTQDQRNMIDQEVSQLGREILSMQNRVEFNTNRVLAMGPQITTEIIGRAGQMAISAANAQTWAGEAQAARDRVVNAMNLLNEMDPTTIGANIKGTQRDIIDLALGTQTFSEQVGGGLSNIALPWNANANSFHDGLNSVIAAIASMADRGTESVADIMAALADRLASIDNNVIASINILADGIQFELRNNYLGARNFAEFRTTVRHVGPNMGSVAVANTGQNLGFFQVGANASQGVFFDFETVSRAVSSAGWTVSMIGSALSAPASGSGIGSGVSISPMIDMVQSSLDDIARVRANLGAVSNRMDYTQRSLDISSENLQDAESRVRNADIAREMMRFTMSNVLQQASVSMLAQANQMPNNLLQLLR